MRFYKGQGATEYLVLLAVVLIVALVSVALLGFFPSMASDAQITQSQTYWQSASPIAIVESSARQYVDTATLFYLRIKNTGIYPIRITALIDPGGNKATQFYAQFPYCGIPVEGSYNISDYYYLAPGEENYFSFGLAFGGFCSRRIYASTSAGNTGRLGNASSLCQSSASSPGTLYYKSLGFEYIQYIEGQQITKRQMGRDWIVKCREQYVP